MKKLEAITPKECGIELNESKALESLFKKMQLAYAADLVLDGDAAKEKFTQDFQELSKVVDAIADSIIRDHEGKQVAPPDKESLCAKIANKININDLVAMKGNVAVALKNNYVRLFGSDAKFLEQLGKVASEGDIEEMAPAKQGLKSQYDEKLATLKRKVEALGYGNNVCNDLIDTVTKGMGDLKPEMLSLLDPQSVKTVEKCIARMNDRINALEFVARLKQKHEDDFSLGDRPNPDFYALFLKEAEELIVTASVGGLFKSEENVKNFVESRCTSLSVEDRMALKQDVDELSNFTTDANLFKQKVTHMLIRTGEITAKIIQTTGGSVFFDKGRGEIGPDDQIEMYMALFKSLIGPYLDRIFEAAARLGVKNDELSQLDLSSYTVDRRTKFDMQYDQSNAMKLNTWVVQYTGTAFVRLLGQQG